MGSTPGYRHRRVPGGARMRPTLGPPDPDEEAIALLSQRAYGGPAPSRDDRDDPGASVTGKGTEDPPRVRGRRRVASRTRATSRVTMDQPASRPGAQGGEHSSRTKRPPRVSPGADRCPARRFVRPAWPASRLRPGSAKGQQRAGRYRRSGLRCTGTTAWPSGADEGTVYGVQPPPSAWQGFHGIAKGSRLTPG
jgi:hypothetical protein